ncbi:MAG: hypothetical protein ERJ68_00135 [Aphanocapsa feldmannii 277cI]|uniref:Uncharacterized protein n=1 Tax=Aphanocapsa feldmannii 277cI TaxID=2507554 RepID=A0A524RW20_9CHRO|nr:MAG: hypothetical protein ERJ68_00135 [Aphanocapsa feldmannii 277cI]
MWIQLQQPMMLCGDRQKEGSRHNVDERLATELIAAHRAVEATPPAPAQVTPPATVLPKRKAASRAKATPPPAPAAADKTT